MNRPDPLALMTRNRRLRRNENVRAMVREHVVSVDDVIAPLFVQESLSPEEEIESMPGIFRYSLPRIVEECVALRTLGIRAVALFSRIGVELKDPLGREAFNPDGLMPRTVKAIKRTTPDLVVICDIALDPYTSHGHDGVLNAAGEVDNDATVARLAEMALVLARAGADWVAPSDMMDGRVAAIRHALDAAGFMETAILSYAAKFASAYYGPFRDAVGSASAAEGYLEKRTYQLDPANAREAVRDALLDEEEGADLLMVKPAGPYLDILHGLRARTALPLVAYQVSGEYAQICAAARLGWLDYEKTRDEALLAIKRAGADLIISYFAREVAQSRPHS
ncbi:MAG: porphobilinogen synthase [Verrucomicrobiota bacterium]|nr:porphobilinogen synthase [Verrucomicrobiota bacterium]